MTSATRDYTYYNIFSGQAKVASGAHIPAVPGSIPGPAFKMADTASKTTRLTEKQRKFVEAFQGAAACNATEAARLAGYSGSDSALGKQGFDNLRNPKIVEALAKTAAEDPLVLERVDLQRFWTRVVLDQEGVDTEMKDRLRASEMLAKSQGMFVNRVEHTGKDGGAVKVETQQGPDLTQLSPEQLREYKRCMAQAVEALKPKEDDDA